MKYLAIFGLTFFVLLLIVVLVSGGAILISIVMQDPRLIWVPMAIVAIIAISAIAALIEYLTDRPTKVEGEVID